MAPMDDHICPFSVRLSMNPLTDVFITNEDQANPTSVRSFIDFIFLYLALTGLQKSKLVRRNGHAVS
jgi:hypothetical protein